MEPKHITSLGLSEYDNVGVLYTPQTFRAGASPPDTILCHILNTLFWQRWQSYPSSENTASTTDVCLLNSVM